jgi:hypothetical protein
LDIGYFLTSLFDIYSAKVRPSMIRPAQLIVSNIGLQAIVPDTQRDSQRLILPWNASIKRLVGVSICHIADQIWLFLQFLLTGDRGSSIGLPAPAHSKMSHHSGDRST